MTEVERGYLGPVNISGLDDLPDSLLQHVLLPKLDAPDLAMLACCNRRMSRTATVDDLWRPLFNTHFNMSFLFRKYYKKVNCGEGDPPPCPWPTWHCAFCYQQSIRCVECKEHTPYIFTLSPSHVRLCERCEQASPKYALVTELEAKGVYLLDDDDLRNLPFKVIKIKKTCLYLFLKEAVEELAYKKQKRIEEGRSSDISKEGQVKNLISDEMDCSPSSVQTLERHGESLSDGSETDRTNDNVNSSAGIFVQTDRRTERSDKRAMRKKHKQQVKSENREKRMTKASGKDAQNRSTRTNYRSGCSQFNETKSNIEVEMDEKVRIKSKHRSKREHVAAASVGAYRGHSFLGYVSQLKTKSPSVWIKEREWLEAELGQNGISALELAL
eukprot:TRINITY_DN17035_c0_g1_i2.p1 TRINITY_DN17035_c0_g1~~TRINITY_DN17035_c0_g1_i2.p1  ORF type:complete len:385 (-),score=60.35 TRINITY_DN17035_c0_g1_i2:76-1230(-)